MDEQGKEEKENGADVSQENRDQADYSLEEKKTGMFANKKYLTICKYALLVITCGVIIVMLVARWHMTKAFVGNLIGILSPFFAALLIAYFLSPLVEKINGGIQKYIAKGRAKRGIKYFSILLAYIIVLAFIGLACRFVIPQLVDSTSDLAGNVPAMYNKIYHFLMNIETVYPDLNLDYVAEKLNDMVPDLVNFGTNVMGNVLPFVYSFSVSLVKLCINIMLSVIISVYMISGKRQFQFQIKRVIYSIFNEQRGDSVCRTCRECNDIFSAFLIGKAVDSLIIGCLCCLIMSILRLPYAVLLSVIVGITNMIPYFGPFIGAVPGILIYLCISPKDAIIFTIMIFCLQQFDGLILGPRILGQSTGLGPMWVIFGITVGGAYFGVIGMFIGVPVIAVLAHLINKAIRFRLAGREIAALERYANEEES